MLVFPVVSKWNIRFTGYLNGLLWNLSKKLKKKKSKNKTLLLKIQNFNVYTHFSMVCFIPFDFIWQFLSFLLCFEMGGKSPKKSLDYIIMYFWNSVGHVNEKRNYLKINMYLDPFEVGLDVGLGNYFFSPQWCTISIHNSRCLHLKESSTFHF